MKRVVFGLATVFFLQGCSDADVEAPNIKAEAAFSCKQLNGLFVAGDSSGAGRIISSSFKQVSAEYTEGTAIQEFYRRTVGSFNDDLMALHGKVKDSCISDSSQSVPGAITSSLNSYFEEISKKPRFATCKSLNDGLIVFDDILDELKSPTSVVVGGDQAGSYAITAYNNPRYGAEYLEKGVSEKCAENPHTKIWSTLWSTGKPAFDAVVQESMDRVKAEADNNLRRSIESDLSRVSPDLFSKDLASCKEFVAIVDRENHAGYGEIHEEYAEKFAGVLAETIKKIDPAMSPAQKEKFDSLRENQIDGLVEGIYKVCESSWFNSHSSDIGELELAVMQVEEISSAKSSRELEALSLYEEKARLNNCPRSLRDGEYCESKNEQDAASAAHSYVAECDKSGESDEGLCALSVGEIYEYNLLAIRKEQLSKDVKRIGDYLLDPKKTNYNAEFYIRDLAAECGRKGVDAGLRGPEYGSYYDEKCLPAATEEFLKEDRLKLEVAERDLKEIESALVRMSSQ